MLSLQETPRLERLADSRIGVTRKLATCERGRQVRRVNTAIKRAAERNLSAKAKRRSASPDDPRRRQQRPRGYLSRPSTPLLPVGSPAGRVATPRVHARRVRNLRAYPSVCLSPAPASGPSISSRNSCPPCSGTTRGRRDETRSGSRSSSESLEMFPGEGEGEGEGDATLDPDLLLDPNPILPSLGASEMLDGRGRAPSRPAASSISSWTRQRRPSCPGACDCTSGRASRCRATIRPRTRRWRRCKAVPSEGVFGARAVTVSVMSDAVLGHGWKTPSAGGGETVRFRLGVRIGIAVFRQPRRHLRREDAGVVRASVDHALPGVGARAPGGCARATLPHSRLTRRRDGARLRPEHAPVLCRHPKCRRRRIAPRGDPRARGRARWHPGGPPRRPGISPSAGVAPGATRRRRRVCEHTPR